MKSLSRAPTSEASTPSWASRRTAMGGIGGFDDLSGIEAKTAPAPVVAVDPSATIRKGDISSRPPSVGGTAMDIGLNKILSMGMTKQELAAGPDKSLPVRQPTEADEDAILAAGRPKVPAVASFGGGASGGTGGAGRSFDGESKPVTYKTATATVYTGDDDEFGDKSAFKNPKGEFKSIDGQTVAVDGTAIPHGVWIEVLHKDGTKSKHFTNDTGSAVKKGTASQKRGNKNPVIDFKFPSGTNANSANAKIGNSIQYRILPKDEI